MDQGELVGRHSVVSMSRAKSQPTRKIVRGIEYFSIAAAAEAIGCDVRTLTQLEKAGVMPRAEHVLPGDPRARWYTAEEPPPLSATAPTAPTAPPFSMGQARPQSRPTMATSTSTPAQMSSTGRIALVGRPPVPAWLVHKDSRERKERRGRKERTGPQGPVGTSGTSALFGNNPSPAGQDNNAPGATCTLGEVNLVAGTRFGNNWMAANGQVLSISANQALFSLLGTTYGGNGQSTFAAAEPGGRSPHRNHAQQRNHVRDLRYGRVSHDVSTSCHRRPLGPLSARLGRDRGPSH